MAQSGIPVVTLVPVNIVGTHVSPYIELALVGPGSKNGTIRFTLLEMFTPAFSDTVDDLYVVRFAVACQDGDAV